MIVNKSYKKFGAIIMIIPVLITLLLGYVIYGKIENSKNVCAWCNGKIWGEGSQIREYWLHDRCFSMLNERAGEKFGNKYCGERMEWIHNRIKERGSK